MIQNNKWLRARFHANPDDYRSIKWPPVGPYWCSGHGDDYSIVVAYVRTPEQITEQWPEATEISAEEVEGITFSDRFACPGWWDSKKGEAKPC